MIRFDLLTDEETLQRVQNTSSLFYNDCRPADLTLDRHAVVTTTDNTMLLVLSHQDPFRENPVVIRALVLDSRAAVAHLVRFLGDFTRASGHCMRGVRIGGPELTTLHLTNGVTCGDVEQALRTLKFQTGAPGTVGT